MLQNTWAAALYQWFMKKTPEELRHRIVEFARIAPEFTHREIAKQTGISHITVGRILRDAGIIRRETKTMKKP